MKILFITNSYPTLTHPTRQVFVKNIRNEMDFQGHTTDLIFNKLYKSSQRFTSRKNIAVKAVKALGLIFSIIFNIRKFFKSDVIFSHAILFPTFYAVCLKPIHKKRVVCYVHGGDLNLFINKKGILKRLMVFSLKKADKVIANSRDINDKIRKLGIADNKLFTVPPGVNLTLMTELNKKTELKSRLGLYNKFVLLCVGNAIHRKGHDQLLRCIKSLNEKQKEIPIHLILVTEGPELSKYKEYIDTNNLTDRVTINPFVEQQKLVEIYNTADVFVFPSREEPLGLAAIEAMACGLPVIGADVGGIREVTNNGAGFLYEPENIYDLGNKIEMVYRKDYDLKKNEIAMKKKVQQYSLKENVQQMIKILEVE